MYIVHVYARVKANQVERFKIASVKNAHCSRHESGIARFDVFQQKDDPSRFLLVEIYHTEADAARHKETEHYKHWRDAVAEMMAEPRCSIKYDDIVPADDVD